MPKNNQLFVRCTGRSTSVRGVVSIFYVLLKTPNGNTETPKQLLKNPEKLIRVTGIRRIRLKNIQSGFPSRAGEIAIYNAIPKLKE